MTWHRRPATGGAAAFSLVHDPVDVVQWTFHGDHPAVLRLTDEQRLAWALTHGRTTPGDLGYLPESVDGPVFVAGSDYIVTHADGARRVLSRHRLLLEYGQKP